MTALRVLRAGIHATVQDAGRSGYRALGVPGSGALDVVALRLANALVHNPSDAPAVEMLYSGITVEAFGGTARIAVACADATIERRSGTAETLPAWHSARLHEGDRLRIAAPVATAAAYLAVEGAYAVPAVLGSASTYVQGHLGGYEGRSLRTGDTLHLMLDACSDCDEKRLHVAPTFDQPSRLRVIPGRQVDRFVDTALDTMLSGQYRVLPASNRSGLRLEGPALAHRGGHDLMSEGVATGSIQVPGSAQPVVLIADHPTVGGYPKIASVISADWPAAGRLKIGSTVGFALVTEADAASARRAQHAWIAETIASIERQ